MECLTWVRRLTENPDSEGINYDPDYKDLPAIVSGCSFAYKFGESALTFEYIFSSGSIDQNTSQTVEIDWYIP